MITIDNIENYLKKNDGIKKETKVYMKHIFDMSDLAEQIYMEYTGVDKDKKLGRYSKDKLWLKNIMNCCLSIPTLKDITTLQLILNELKEEAK